ncbi:MAG TPA: 50S ribosomal protein L20 [Candidatus Dojkabacteria bacterium]|jgi:large subunit ribosomal protein L20|nr:50S ribosomal protein L20 [Candidatus Dojkabacteria bacterium]
MRVKTGVARKRRHSKVLARTKGYRMTKNRLYRVSHEAFMHAGQYAYNDRQKRGAQMRKVWITKINAACKNNNIQYKDLISGLKKKKIELNRMILADLAVNNPTVFTSIVKSL